MVIDVEDYTKIQILRDIINEWGTNNLRIYPWRDIKDIYIILTTEIMLHRTRADKVAEVFNTFFDEYPDVFSLSEAKESDVKKIIKPLGLSSRANRFISMAKYIRSKFHGEIPEDRAELLKINGVGQYIAGMVLMCAFEKQSWAVDTNIARVINRVMGLFLPPENYNDRELILYSKYYFDIDNPRYTAYSLLDFGAAVCKSPTPYCTRCPVARHFICSYFECYERPKMAHGREAYGVEP
jgi:A/G-specific adenine glycosylase